MSTPGKGEGSSTPRQHTPNTLGTELHARAQSIARGVADHLRALADHHQEVASRYDALNEALRDAREAGAEEHKTNLGQRRQCKAAAQSHRRHADLLRREVEAVAQAHAGPTGGAQ